MLTTKSGANMRLEKWMRYFLAWTAVSYAHATETDHLKYYETLSHVHVSSHVKRSTDGDAELLKRVQFYAFQRNFHLTLRSGSPVLAKNFRARLIHKDGTSTTFPVDQSKIFTGHDTFNPQTAVHAHLEDSLWAIHVLEENETYALEPAWRILRQSENPHNDTLVAYRMSDLKGIADGSLLCNAAQKQPSRVNPWTYKNLHHGRSQSHVLTFVPRGRRREERSTVRNTCEMYLVGDADLFNKRCQRNHFSCSSLMIEYLQFADNLFRSSPFVDVNGRKHYGIGIQIGELALLTDYTGPSLTSYSRHFNEKFDHWNADTKLTAFAHDMKVMQRKYCLNHLFTEFADPKGVLGLAYVDQLCRWRSHKMELFNTGITSGTNKVGFLLPSLATSIVLSHELGHNFGSNHDPDTVECAPADNHGGKYLMWHLAGSGSNPNNKKFSKCSLRAIGRRIPSHCFQERSQINFFCGNGIVDKGEECDAGVFGMKDDNKCCSKNCTLKPGAVCSEVNHECCVNCQVAPATTVCRHMENTHSCLNTSYCLGTDTVCRDGGFKSDGTVCGEMHKCYSGVCTSPCEQETMRRKTVRLKSCQCDKNSTEACLWCCFDVTDPQNPGECKPILPHPRNDGTSCIFGTCRDGLCVMLIQYEYKTRLSAYIRFVRKSSLEQFLRANIVLVVVVLSLMLWVPSSLWIHSIDMEEQRIRDTIMDALLEEATLREEGGEEDGNEEEERNEEDEKDEEDDYFDPHGLETSSAEFSSWHGSTMSADYHQQLTRSVRFSMKLKGSSTESQRSHQSSSRGLRSAKHPQPNAVPSKGGKLPPEFSQKLQHSQDWSVASNRTSGRESTV